MHASLVHTNVTRARPSLLKKVLQDECFFTYFTLTVKYTCPLQASSISLHSVVQKPHTVQTTFGPTLFSINIPFLQFKLPVCIVSLHDYNYLRPNVTELSHWLRFFPILHPSISSHICSVHIQKCFTSNEKNLVNPNTFDLKTTKLSKRDAKFCVILCIAQTYAFLRELQAIDSLPLYFVPNVCLPVHFTRDNLHVYLTFSYVPQIIYAHFVSHSFLYAYFAYVPVLMQTS